MFGNAVKPTHILIVLLIVLLLFGAKRLPDLAKSVGQSLKIFKAEIKDLTEDSTTTGAPVVPPVTAVPPATPPAAPPVAPPTESPAAPVADDGTGSPRT